MLTKSKKVNYSSNGFNKLRAGLPFVFLLAGGSLLLSTFVQGTVEGRDKRVRSQSEREYSIEKEHEKMMQKLNIQEGFKNKRIVRPEEHEINPK